ncbi:MAG: M20/M25/M40 family metallo-hydrolase [Actinomycetia bacterium]|nr:M20/M25/M40 family metallo-hydrolase [Actinomycetes bacterium]
MTPGTEYQLPDTIADRYLDDAVSLTRRLIRNACVNTGDPASGNEIVSVMTIQEYLGDTGTVVEPLPGRASVVYRMRGTEPTAPRLLLIPHLDVVPAETASWSRDPFAGDIVDGFIWGRGAVDMLNLTASMVAVFKSLLDGSTPAPRGDVILAAVADEEAGGIYGAQHLVEHHWDLVACDMVLTEVAGPSLTGPGGTALPVTVAEKGSAWRKVHAHGTSGHGSQPYARDNAVVNLARAFADIATTPQPLLITPEWSRFVQYLPVDEAILDDLRDPERIDQAIEQIAETDVTLARWVHACTHLTLSPTVIQGGGKANVVPSSADGEIDIRILPGQDANDLSDHLRKVLGPDRYDEIDFEVIFDIPANVSPPEGPLWDAIQAAAEIHTGLSTLAPTLTPVMTDARFFRALGIPAYGVGLFDDSVTFGEMLAMFHGADERVSVESVRRTTAFLATVIERLSEPR